jgi:4-aminobutyrate aminotransferase
LKLIKDGMMQNAAEVGEYTLDALSEIQVRHPCIGEVRGKGLMIGIEFVKDRDSKEPDKTIRDRIISDSFNRGILTFGCGESAVRFCPALNITKDLMDEALSIFEAAVTQAETEGIE